MAQQYRTDPLLVRLEEEGKIRNVRAQGRLVRISENNQTASIVLDRAVLVLPERGKEREESYTQKRLMVSFSLPEGETQAALERKHLWVKGTLELYQGARNPGEFDARLYYRSQQIRCRLRANTVQEGKDLLPPFERQVQSFSRAAKEAVNHVFAPEDRGFYQAVLLGDRSELEEETKTLFSASGIAHILAVSGLHVSLIGLGLFGLLRKAGLGLRGAGLASGAVLLFYGAVTGFGPSVYRAVFMLCCSFAAAWLGRTYDLLSAMALSLLFLLWDSPFLLFTGGLQLSYGAVAAIGLETERKKREAGEKEKERGLKAQIADSLSVSLSIQLVTLPMILYHYFFFPPWGILLNLIVIPLMSYAAGSGIAALGFFGIHQQLLRLPSGRFPALFSQLFGWASYGAAGPGHYIFSFYRHLCEWSGYLPFSSILTGRPEWWQTALYYTALVWFYGGRADGKQKSRRTAVPVCLSIFFLFVHPVHGLDIWFLDVGQGDGAVIRTAEITILSDCGSSQERRVGEKRLVPFLKSQGIGHLDYIFISHGDADHINGITWMLEEEADISAGCLVLPAAGKGEAVYEELEELARSRQMQIRYMKAGERLETGKLTLSCLAPAADGEMASARRTSSEEGITQKNTDRNSHSLVLSVAYGSFRMLLTGDIGAEEERTLSLPPVSVLKAAHHGSAGSSCREFLEAVRPSVTILSYGEGNSYGHPARETIERLKEQNSRLFHTAKSGAIRIRTDGRRMKITGFLRKPVDKKGADGL